MTKHKRVQDRSNKRRVVDLETVTERFKITSKLIAVMDVLKNEPEQVITVRRLEQYRQKINLSKPHSIAEFIRKSPKLFELYKDQKGVLWCGFTAQAEDLVEEEATLIEENSEKAAEHVSRLLMMAVDQRIPLDKIVQFRRDLGLPYDLRTSWIHRFPQLFKLVKFDDVEHLQLVEWNPEWAVTELEKKARREGIVSGEIQSEPGMLCLPFPMKFPPLVTKLFRHGGRVEHFQKRPYLSPYADPRELIPGSQEFDKRAVAVMHEILSFTHEKRLVTDQLTYFRREFVMPQKLMRLFLKHYGIFYVSEKGKRFSVFLTEAYNGDELIEKSPLVLWKEKVLRITGYRGRRKRSQVFNQSSEVEEHDLFGGDLDSENTFVEIDDEENVDTLRGVSLSDDSEMDVGDLEDYMDVEST